LGNSQRRGGAVNMQNVTSLARTLPGVNVTKTKIDLAHLGYLYLTADGYRVYSQHREVLFAERRSWKTGRMDIYATAKGAALMVSLYRDGKLTMKVGHRAMGREWDAGLTPDIRLAHLRHTKAATHHCVSPRVPLSH
jgi:hypothetical protein